jgi:6-phosphogluconolactonase
MPKAVFYQSIGPELARYDIDVDGAALVRRDAVTTPGANVQYVWSHPSKKFLYVVSSDGGPGTIPGTRHVATAFRIDPASGALTPHGDVAPLPSRPVHCSVDRSGEYLLTAYNYPSDITVHRIKPDGTLGEQVPPREKLDVGIFAHQVLTTPDNRTAIMVTRGNNPEANKAEDPGALKVYDFQDGVLSNLASISAATALASAHAISTFISTGLGCSSRLSGKANCTSTNSTTTARCRATRCSSRTRSRTAPTTRPRRWPAPSTFIRTADLST